MDASTRDTIEVIYWMVSILILVATVYVIYKGPIEAVRVGRDLNNQQLQDNSKRSLFLTLFSYRGSPVHYVFVNALNQIDVVFHDNPTVIAAWHKYYEALHHQDLVNKDDVWTQLRVELLSQMAISLGYPRLSQVDITKHYYPQGHEFQNRTDFEHKQAAYEYHKIGVDAYKLIIEGAKNPAAVSPPSQENGKHITSSPND